VAVDDHILISLEPRHAENILEGRKRVELRRRAMNVISGRRYGYTLNYLLALSSVERSSRLFTCLQRQHCGSDLVQSPESHETNSLSTSPIEKKGSLWSCPAVGA
jgi:hypothetical protein